MDTLRALQRQDDALRALLTARTQALPPQLAELRVARRVAAGYGRPAATRPSLVDQRR
jgi:hypothetical protein